VSGPSGAESNSSAPLDFEAFEKYQEILSEPVGFLPCSKGELLEVAKNIMGRLAPFQMFIIGGAAQKILFDYPKNDLDIAFYAQPGSFELFTHQFLPYLHSLGLQTGDPKSPGFIRINPHHQILSFFDVDIKFPSAADRSHLFDDNALVVDATLPQVKMTLVPGCIFGQGKENLEYAIACNREKTLVLSDPNGVKNFSLRTILRCTQGWSANPFLLKNALTCLQQESLETFQRNLDLFLLGHGSQNRPLFLINLQNLLERSQGNENKISFIHRAFFADGLPLIDPKKEIHSLVISALRSGMDYDEKQCCFYLNGESFFLAKSLEETFLEICNTSCYGQKDVTDILKNWIEASTSKGRISPVSNPTRARVGKHLLEVLSTVEHKEVIEELSAYFRAKEEHEQLQFFKRLSPAGMAKAIVENGTASEKEWELLRFKLKEALEEISLKDLHALASILQGINDFKTCKPLFWRALFKQQQIDLEQLLTTLSAWDCEEPTLFLLDLVHQQQDLDELLVKEYHSSHPSGPKAQDFWCLALKNPKVQRLLGLEGLILDPLFKEAFLPFLLQGKNLKLDAFLERTKEEWSSKVSSWTAQTLQKGDWQILLERIEDFADCSSHPSQVGFFLKKTQIFFSMLQQDLSSCHKEWKTFPKALQECLRIPLYEQVFLTKKGSLEFFKGGSQTPFKDAKYFDFLLTHYPKGIGEGYMEYALENETQFEPNNSPNTRYLQFLKQAIVVAKGPLRSILLDRLADFEDFEGEPSPEVFTLSLAKGKIPPQKMQKFLPFVLEISDWENLDKELLAPLFEPSFLLSLDFSLQLKLIEKAKLFSVEDLALRTEILQKNGAHTSIGLVLVEGARQGFFLDFPKIIEKRAFFIRAEDFVLCLPWSDSQKMKKAFTYEIFSALLKDSCALSQEKQQILIEMSFGFLARLTPSEWSLLAKLYVELSSQALDWERIANETISGPFFELKTPENVKLIHCLAEKVRSKKKIYEPLKAQLIGVATQREELAFLTNRELIEAIKKNSVVIELLLIDRAYEGQLTSKDFSEILKRGGWSKSLIASLLQGLEKKESMAKISQEILLLSIVDEQNSLELCNKFSFFEKLSLEEYKRYAPYIDKALEEHPDSTQIYCNWLLSCTGSRSYDIEGLNALKDKILQAKEPLKVAYWIKEPLCKLSSWPTPFLFLMKELAHQTQDASLMVRCLFEMRDSPHFSENFILHLWALKHLAQQEPIDFDLQENQMGCAILRHYWREKFLDPDALSYNIVEFLPLFPKDANERFFVQLVMLLENFSQNLESSIDLEKDYLENFGENLKLFMGCSLREPKVELIYPILDQMEDLLQKISGRASLKNGSIEALRNTLFKNIFFIKNLCVFAAEDLMKKGDSPLIASLRQELGQKTTFIMMEILPTVLDLENDLILINGVFCSKELPVNTVQNNLLYIKAYFLLGQRLFLERGQEKIESHLTKIFYEVLYGMIDKAIQNRQLDRESFQELLFFHNEMLAHFDHLKKEIQIGAIELFTKLLSWGIQQNSVGLNATFKDDLPFLKQITPTIFDLLADDEKLHHLEKWTDSLTALNPEDKEIHDFVSILHARRRASLMTFVFETPDLETQFNLYFAMVPPEGRFPVLMELIDCLERRLSTDQTPIARSPYTQKALCFLAKEILKPPFQEFLFDKQPQRKKNTEKLLYRFMDILANRSSSFEVKESFCDPQFPLMPLFDAFVSLEFDPNNLEELFRKIFIPLIRNFGYIFHPKILGSKMDAQAFLDEKRKGEMILSWLEKLEYMEEKIAANLQFFQSSAFRGELQDTVVSLLARCEVKKIPQIRARIEPHFGYFKTALLQRIFLINHRNAQNPPELQAINRRRASIMIDVYKYLAGCGLLFDKAQTQEIREIRRFYLEEPPSADGACGDGAR